jgi:uncharacterized protein YbjT (DUF2867 family)
LIKKGLKTNDASKKPISKKFVMLSSMGADKPEEASQLQEYLHAKTQCRRIFKSSGLQYSIVRPGTLTNDSPIEDCARAQIKQAWGNK